MLNTHNSPELIVVGGGIAGSAAVLRAAQYQLRVLWIRGSRKDAKRSRSQWVVNVDNMIGVHEGIIRKKVDRLLARDDQFEAARAAIATADPMAISTRDIVRNTVDRIESEYGDWVTMIEQTATKARRTSDGQIELTLGGDPKTVKSHNVVLATGVMDRQPEIFEGQANAHVENIKWIYPAANREQALYCIRCEGHLTRDRKVVVVGHGESSAQVAMMLHERYGSVASLITHGESPEWSAESDKVLQAYGIPVIHERLTKFDSERNGLRRTHFANETSMEVDFALVSLGLYRVYNDLAVDLDAELADPGKPTSERHVLINSNGTTSVDGLFAIGDMTSRSDEQVMKQIYTSQEYAVRAIDTIDRARRTKMKKRALLALSLKD